MTAWARTPLIDLIPSGLKPHDVLLIPRTSALGWRAVPHLAVEGVVLQRSVMPGMLFLYWWILSVLEGC